MSVPTPRGPSKTPWQYHSRSDSHSKVACWGVLFDLLQHSALLQRHADAGTVVFGVNFEMRDFGTGRKKKLDLVVARPTGGASMKEQKSLASLADAWNIVLDPEQRQRLDGMPSLQEGPIGAVLVAMEAKAAMTAHTKAQPRLYDELNSSHATVHGASSQALAVGFVMVNVSDTFISPDLNKEPALPTVVSVHRQPADALGIVRKVHEIPRRTSSHAVGYDGLAIVVIDCPNDGSPVRLVTDPPSPQPGGIYHYDSMIVRIANEYDTTFASI